MKSNLFFFAALLVAVSVFAGGATEIVEPVALEGTVAITIEKREIVIENLPLTLGQKEVRVYILEDLKKQLATLEEKIMANVEDSLSGIATEMAYSYRCHIFHGPYGNITGCGGTPYDCLCVVVTAPPY